MSSWCRQVSGYLDRLFSYKQSSEAALYHKRQHDNPLRPGFYMDFMDGTAYQSLDIQDPRHILFGLAFDGYLPYADDKKFSLWPLVLTPFNFSPKIR